MTERTAVASSSAQTPDDSSTMNNMATLMLSLSLIYLLPLLPPADVGASGQPKRRLTITRLLRELAYRLLTY